MLLKNIIVIENFTCNIVFSEANLSLGLVNILQNYIAEMVRWHLKTWITDYKRVQENFHSLKKKKKTKWVYMQTEFQYKHYMGF